MSDTMERTTNHYSALDLTLYHMHPVRSARVKWLAHELGISDNVSIEEVDLAKGDQFQASFREMNKMCTIPVVMVKHKMDDKQMVMTESSAICLWLTDLYAHVGLKPDVSNVFATGQYYRFVCFAASTIDPILWDIRMHEQVLPEEQRSRHVADAARKNFLERVVPTLEDVLGGEDGQEFVCEPYHKGFTTADLMVGFSLYWSTMYDLLADAPILRKYLKRCIGRSEFQAAMRKKSASL